jgi:hypothetical protein
MPRSMRHEYAGAVCHVMCRGNNGQPIFRTDPRLNSEHSGSTGKGERLFLSTLEEACRQTGRADSCSFVSHCESNDE